MPQRTLLANGPMASNLKTTTARLLIACLLCVLAMAFGVEAKIACFGPLTGPGSDVRAAKALPSDAPRVAHTGENSSNPFHLPVSFTLLAIVAAVSLAYNSVVDRWELSVGFARNFTSDYFSSRSLRAPPVRS